MVDAIDRGDMENLKEELGDVLYQIVFHARIAEEKGLFTMQDVADGIAGKMVRRHPLVFGGGESGKHEDASWEAQKLREKRRAHLLDGLPTSLPSLLFACIMQKKVSSICDEKTEPQPDWESLLAEMPRLAAGDSGSEEREFLFGRAFFAMVRFAGLCGVDPELALHRFNWRYARRLGLLENRLREEGKTLADAAPAMLRELSADGQGGNGSLSSECGV